jgi:hypothetical protein
MIPVLRCSADPPGAWAVAARDPGRALVRRPVAPFVHLLLAEDEGHTLRYAARDDVAEPGPAFVAALLALEPLPRLHRTEAGWWTIQADDGVEPSRVCLPLQRSFPEPMVCAVPDARTLWLAPEALAGRLLAATHERWAAAGTPISPLIYGLGSAGPTPYPADGALVVPLRRAAAALAARAWERQRDALERLFDVAFGPALLRDDDCVAVWPDPTRPALLPATERVLVDGREMAIGSLRPSPWPALDPPRVLVRPAHDGPASA